MNHYENLDNIIVTGGAGFIGSHVVDALIEKDIAVKVFDDLSSGTISNLSKNIENKKFHFTKINLNNSELLNEITEDVKMVFHLAADPEVRTGFESPQVTYDKNILSTFNLLEGIRKKNVEQIFFTSSSVVYGEPETIPTSEEYGPLLPISHYGSSKLACEALISSYCHNYGIQSIIFRLANVIGQRSRHGVIWDFINKLQNNESELEVLGDGKQSKSYLHVTDCVEGFFHGIANIKKKVDVFNLGTSDRIDVLSIAKIVCDAMGLKNVKIKLSGGVENGRGWIGDVKKMHLDTSKMQKTGWIPKFSSSEAVKIAVKELVKEKMVNYPGQ